MSRRVVVLFTVCAAVLAIVADADAKPIAPASGPYSGLSSQHETASLAVKGGKLELKGLGVDFTCTYQGAPLPVPTVVTAQQMTTTGKPRLLPIKNGKFSYKGPLAISSGTPPTVNFSGSFKSPKKLAGQISIGSFKTELYPGAEGECAAIKVSFTAKHS